MTIEFQPFNVTWYRNGDRRLIIIEPGAANILIIIVDVSEGDGPFVAVIINILKVFFLNNTKM